MIKPTERNPLYRCIIEICLETGKKKGEKMLISRALLWFSAQFVSNESLHFDVFRMSTKRISSRFFLYIQI